MNNTKVLNPRGTKEFAYESSNSVTKLQKYFIRIIEFAFPTIKFKGVNSREAYDFIGKYKEFVEYDKKSGSVYTNIGGKRMYKGKLYNNDDNQPTFVPAAENTCSF